MGISFDDADNPELKDRPWIGKNGRGHVIAHGETAGGDPKPILVDSDGGLIVDVEVGDEINVNLQDGAGTDITSTLVGSDQSLDVNVTQSTLPSGAATAANQLPDGHNVTVDNGAGGAAVNVQDGGNSLTVDNSAIDTNIDTPLSTLESSLNSINSAQLADGHNVTVDNAAGASAVNVQDGGNSLTIDNTNLDTPLSTLESSLNSINSAQLADGHNVTVDNAAGAAAVNIQDGGNSITVDGTVTADAGTGNFNVNLQDGAGTDLTSTLVGADQSLDVNVTQSALPSGAATAANQLPDGHNVTVDNASGASAVNIQDGGNSITVDQATHDNLNLNANLQFAGSKVSPIS